MYIPILALASSIMALIIALSIPCSADVKLKVNRWLWVIFFESVVVVLLLGSLFIEIGGQQICGTM